MGYCASGTRAVGLIADCKHGSIGSLKIWVVLSTTCMNQGMPSHPMQIGVRKHVAFHPPVVVCLSAAWALVAHTLLP